MPQSNLVTGAILIAFMVYITAKGRLADYVGLIFARPRIFGGASGSSGQQPLFPPTVQQPQISPVIPPRPNQPPPNTSSPYGLLDYMRRRLFGN